MTPTDTLRRGISAAQAGRRAEARALLTQVVEADENQLEAWLWLSQVSDSPEDQAVCLENALTLDPDNLYARAELDKINARQAALFTPTYQAGEEQAPPAPVASPDDEFDNEWLCPYCLALTTPADRSCLACQKPLIVRKRVQPDRSPWLWRAILLQFIFATYLVAFGLAYLTIGAKLRGVSNPLLFLPLYFGLPAEGPAQPAGIVLGVLSPWAFWSVLAATLYALVVLGLLYFRVAYTNVIYLVNAGILLLLGVLTSILFFSSTGILVGAVIGLLVGLFQLIITLNLWNDFSFKEYRLRLRVDSGAKNHPSLYLSARTYAEEGMWGTAVVHLRRAVAKEPKLLPYHVLLALAYLNLKRYDLAGRAIGAAERLDPNDAEVIRLRQELLRLRP